MADTDDTAERTEWPTPLRLADARRDGQVARSAALSVAVILGVGAGLLAVAAGPLRRRLTRMMAGLLSAELAPGDTRGLGAAAWAALRPVAEAAGVFAACVLLVAVLANFVQIGALFAPKRVRPDAQRLSAGAGLKRMFSLRSTIRVVLGLARIATVAGVVWLSAGSMWQDVLGSAALSPAALADRAADLAWTLGLRLAGALAVLGLLDLLYQRYQHRRDLRMTRREVLEDLRRTHGDPHTTARRRGARAQSARNHAAPLASPAAAAVNRT